MPDLGAHSIGLSLIKSKLTKETNMLPAQSIYNWNTTTNTGSQQQQSLYWGGNSNNSNRNYSTGTNSWSVNNNGSHSTNSWAIQSSTSVFNNSSHQSFLPKFSDTFNGCSQSEAKGSWNGFKSMGTMRQNSTDHIFGDPRKKMDWEAEVENVFIEEIVKLSDSLRNK